MPLTDIACRNAKPSDKPRKLADEAGLYLLVKSAGKYWRWDYRHSGKRKTMALGVYPEVTLQQAREKLYAERKLLADGTDPMAQRSLAKLAAETDGGNSFQGLAEAWLAHQSNRWELVTLERTRASLATDVFPVLGALPASAITTRQVMDVVKKIEKRGASEIAMRVLQRIKAIYRYGVAHQRLDANPMVNLVPSEILKPRKVQHRAALSPGELPEFLAKLSAYQGDLHTINALHLLMLTAARPGEVRGARWAEFDLPAKMWRIPAERMKMRNEHVIPLSSQAVQILEAMKPLSGVRELVFPSPFYPSKPLSENTFNSAMARMGYKYSATAHGFRALFSTVANEAGWNSDAIERQLAHAERNQVRAAYDRGSRLAERTKMMDWWAEYLAGKRAEGELLQQRTS